MMAWGIPIALILGISVSYVVFRRKVSKLLSRMGS